MEMKFINNHGKNLIIFFAGWGMDWRPFSHLSAGTGYDVALFFNYTNLNPDICNTLECEWRELNPECPIYSMVSKYPKINLVAFGAGVWAASILFDNYLRHLSPQNRFRSLRLLKKIEKSVAINGTLCPVSNIWGIPQRLFNSTLKELEAEVASGKETINTSKCINKYTKRVCGSSDVYKKYITTGSKRGLEDLKNELSALRDNYIFSNAIFWNKIIIGDNDITIPAKNQDRFWSEYELGIDKNNRMTFNASNFTIIHTEDAHFPFFNWEKWDDILNL